MPSDWKVARSSQSGREFLYKHGKIGWAFGEGWSQIRATRNAPEYEEVYKFVRSFRLGVYYKISTYSII